MGILLVALGAVDLMGSYIGFDIWGTMGIVLPEFVWKYSSNIEVALALLLINVTLPVQKKRLNR